MFLCYTCALKACGVNGWCMKFGTTKVASCLCYTGFELQPDGKTCTDTCDSQGCNVTVSDCVKDGAGMASCVCKTGYRNVLGTCVGIDPCGGCPVGATCTATASGNVPYCMCPPGYGMTSTACISGATPTVSSTSITYDQTNYTVTFNTYTMRLNFNACTTLPPITVEATRAILRADRVPGGARDCAAVYAFPWSSWCIGPKTTLRPPVNGTGGSM
ncbi:unnamed protein product [Closterium sp. NIES-64]|nr:unnamed protein product [Closterium sp. NIES-64]